MRIHLKPVEDQVIVITGASSGIGLATARMFAERGAKGLVLVSRNAEALQRLAGELDGGRTKAMAVPADTGLRDDIERVARAAIETFGGFDTWVNDAAVAIYGDMREIPIEDQRRLFEVNYWGVVNGSLVAAEHLRRRGGAIINLGSVLSERAMIFQTQYSASKHAVKGFTEGLRMELEAAGAPISVTLVKPSSIDTPYPDHARNFLGETPTLPPPIYDPHLVAKAIVFAAEHPKRDLTVGFGGFVIDAVGAMAPRLTDKVMEFVGYSSQTSGRSERRGMRDNLYRSRRDEEEYSAVPREPRQTSLFLAAQMHPLATAAILAGIGAAVATLLFPSRAMGRKGQPVRRGRLAAPTRAPDPVQRRSGNGHDRKTLGPAYLAQQEGSVRRQQPRH
jgi:short-subunit dehydrogenase